MYKYCIRTLLMYLHTEHPTHTLMPTYQLSCTENELEMNWKLSHPHTIISITPAGNVSFICKFQPFLPSLSISKTFSTVRAIDPFSANLQFWHWLKKAQTMRVWPHMRDIISENVVTITPGNPRQITTPLSSINCTHKIYPINHQVNKLHIQHINTTIHRTAVVVFVYHV